MFHNPASPDRFLKKPARYEFETLDVFQILWNMKKWYSFYAENEQISDMLQSFNMLIDVESEKLQQVVAEIPFPAGFSFIPWGHHCLIITKCKAVDEALFYLRRTVERGLSRNALDDCIRADLYHTVGAAITNFAEKLPAMQGELAQEILKSNYDLGFVSLPEKYDEDAREDVLEQHMTRFLLELGEGWA